MTMDALFPSLLDENYVKDNVLIVPSLKGKKVFLTGTSRGNHIGYMAAIFYKLNGCTVTLLVRSDDKGKEAINEMKLYSNKNVEEGEMHYVVGDLDVPETMSNVVKDAASKMSNSIDILVISGGNANTSDKSNTKYLALEPTDLESHRIMYNIAVLSPLVLCRECKKYMPPASTSTTGSDNNICIITSEAANTPWPTTLPYNLAKAAQKSLIKQLAFEFAPVSDTSDKPIRVNGISTACVQASAHDRIALEKGISIDKYASIRGSAHPLQRVASTGEIANSILFITSPLSKFTTGEIMVVDGGLSTTNWFNADMLLKKMGKK